MRIKTKSEANNASRSVMMTTFAPFFLSVESRKNSPVLNAMNARAMSGRNAVPSMICRGIMFRQNGPMMIPAVMYAVTLGSLSRFVTRVIKNPDSRMREIDMIATAAGVEPL